MSYDFRLCLPRNGRRSEEIATADEESIAISDPVPAKEERKQRVAGALIAKNPSLQPFCFSFEAIAKSEKISVEEAKGKHRHIELNGPEGSNGIQITLFDDEASVTVPYWHQGEQARRVFEEIWDYLEIIQRNGGYFTYDPQIGRVLDLPADFVASLACYQSISGGVQTASPRQKPKRRSFTVCPERLDRLPYLYRWCVMTGVALFSFYLILMFTAHSKMEALVLVPGAGWFVCKMLMLDVARLRSMGWSPTLTLLNLFPPATVVLQLYLFFHSPKRG